MHVAIAIVVPVSSLKGTVMEAVIGRAAAMAGRTISAKIVQYFILRRLKTSFGDITWL